MNAKLLICSLFVCSLSAETLKQGERDRAMSELHASRKMVIDAASNLSKRQLEWKPAPEKWSVADVVEHLAATEDFLMEQYRQVVKQNPDPAAKPGMKDEEVLKNIRSRDQKVKAPEPLVPKRTFADTAAALAAFQQRRDRSISFVETTQDQDLRLKILKGFNMDAYQLFLMMASHAQRHVDQIAEIRATPGFPSK